jgi:hypothetical protein
MACSPKKFMNELVPPEEAAQLGMGFHHIRSAMACSPKKFIVNEPVPPEEAAQLGMCFQQIRSGLVQLRGPDVPQEIKTLIAFFGQVAASHIEANPATDGTLDTTAAAKAVRALAQAVKHYHAQRNYDQVLYHALLLALRYHQLTVIGNETAVSAGEKMEKIIEGARCGGKERSAKRKPRNREMAQEFKKRRGGRVSDTALMEDIGTARGLKRSASINAIKAGLKDLHSGD